MTFPTEWKFIKFHGSSHHQPEMFPKFSKSVHSFFGNEQKTRHRHESQPVAAPLRLGVTLCKGKPVVVEVVGCVVVCVKVVAVVVTDSHQICAAAPEKRHRGTGDQKTWDILRIFIAGFICFSWLKMNLLDVCKKNMNKYERFIICCVEIIFALEIHQFLGDTCVFRDRHVLMIIFSCSISRFFLYLVPSKPFFGGIN
jgi:hypothetical protein